MTDMKKSTRIIGARFQRPDAYGSISMPVYNSVAYEFDNADDMADAFCGRSDSPDYSRVTNPTVIFLEKQVAAVTGATAVTALNSGMAAISAMMVATASTGAGIVTSRHVFGNTFLLLTRTLARFGVSSSLLDLTDPEAVERQWPDNACCIFLESVTNPQLEIADIKALSRIAHRHGVPLIADTTMIPFTLYDGKALGIDFEIVSSTKYVSGGATSLGGLIIDYGNFPEITTRVKGDSLFNLGAYMTPQAAYMHLLGLENLEVRYARQEQSALHIAAALQSVDGVRGVNYPGLTDSPWHKLAKEQYGGYGAMVTIELADEEACRRFIDRLQLVRRATNLFDNKTLAIHPYSTIFGTIPEDKRREMDISPNLIRLSIGLEDPDDILDDIRQALDNDNN